MVLNVEKVKKRLAELNLGQKDVAEALGVAQPTACQKLNRIRPLFLDEAEKLAKLLQIEDNQFAEYFFSA